MEQGLITTGEAPRETNLHLDVRQGCRRQDQPAGTLRMEEINMAVPGKHRPAHKEPLNSLNTSNPGSCWTFINRPPRKGQCHVLIGRVESVNTHRSNDGRSALFAVLCGGGEIDERFAINC